MKSLIKIQFTKNGCSHVFESVIEDADQETLERLVREMADSYAQLIPDEEPIDDSDDSDFDVETYDQDFYF